MQFDPITASEVHALREHFKLIYGSYDATAFVFDPGVTGTSLQAWLGTPANAAAFAQMCGTYIGPAALISNTTTWAAVIASSTAMAAVIASSTAMAAVAASSTALMAVHASDSALNAVKGSATALAAMRASSKYLLTAMAAYSGATTIPGLASGASYIVLGLSSSNAANQQTSYPFAINTKRSGSSIANTGLGVPANGSDGKTIDLAIPIVGPFQGVNTGGYSFAMGLIRCDV